jgi:hypothetical protein
LIKLGNIERSTIDVTAPAEQKEKELAIGLAKTEQFAYI